MSEINKEENIEKNKEILEKDQGEVVDATGKEPNQEISSLILVKLVYQITEPT